MNRYYVAATLCLASFLAIVFYCGQNWQTWPAIMKIIGAALGVLACAFGFIAPHFKGYREYSASVLASEREAATQTAPIQNKLPDIPFLRTIQISVFVAIMGSNIEYHWSPTGSYLAPFVGFFVAALVSGLYASAYDKIRMSVGRKRSAVLNAHQQIDNRRPTRIAAK